MNSPTRMHPTVKKLPAGLTATNSRGTDYGVICLITDFNAKVSAVYLVLNDRRLPLATQSARQFVLGVQLQYGQGDLPAVATLMRRRPAGLFRIHTYGRRNAPEALINKWQSINV